MSKLNPYNQTPVQPPALTIRNAASVTVKINGSGKLQDALDAIERIKKSHPNAQINIEMTL